MEVFVLDTSIPLASGAGAKLTRVDGAMTVALRRAEHSPQMGRLDPWGAYAVGIGVYNLALTAVPAIMYALLLSEENALLRDRAWLVCLLLFGGRVGAAVVAFLAARGFLGQRLSSSGVHRVGGGRRSWVGSDSTES